MQISQMFHSKTPLWLVSTSRSISGLDIFGNGRGAWERVGEGVGEGGGAALGEGVGEGGGGHVSDLRKRIVGIVES